MLRIRMNRYPWRADATAERLSELEKVAIANALQLEAAQRRGSHSGLFWPIL